MFKTLKSNHVNYVYFRRHIRKHTNDRPYKCELCSYASIQSGNLKKHIQSKHKTVEEVEEQQLPVVSGQKVSISYCELLKTRNI